MKILRVLWLGYTQGWSSDWLLWANIFSIMYSQQIFSDQAVMESRCISRNAKQLYLYHHPGITEAMNSQVFKLEAAGCSFALQTGHKMDYTHSL